MKITNLRCEYLVNPLVIDHLNPRLSWVLASDIRNQYQTGYRILVSSDSELLCQNIGDLWDSGKILSSATSQIVYEGKMLSSYLKCFWKVLVWDKEGHLTIWSDQAFWKMGVLYTDEWAADWIVYDEKLSENELAQPIYFAKNFNLVDVANIKSATLYASALGVYQLDLNDLIAGDHILAPEWTNYHKRVQYQAYDVMHLLVDGCNHLRAHLSNGWYCGLWQKWPPTTHLYGTNPALLLQLEILYNNGERIRVVSDGSWCAATEGPLRFAGIYEGENYDARKKVPILEDTIDEKIWHPVTLELHDKLLLSAQRSEPIKVTQTLKPITVTSPKPGLFVIDFGQNMAGRINIRFHEKKDTLVTIKHNEMLNPEGTVYMDNLVAGCFVENVDRQIIRYICNGEDDHYKPTFTYMGFRYIEINGLTEPPELADVFAEVFHTAFEQVGEFSCSDEGVNRLQKNIQWSQRANMMGVPTDCPQRDERCGYTGDMQFFMPTAVMNMDMAAFMNKWLMDLCQDSQFDNGSYADHAPYFGMNGGIVGWGDAGIICPYLCYVTYGDTKNISEHFLSMQAYTKWLIETSNPDYTRGPDCVGLGDWLNLGGGASKEVIGTAYYAYVLFMMAEMSGAIKKYSEQKYYDELCKKVKTAFAYKYIDEDGSISDSSQTAYALAFTMGLIPEMLKDKVGKAFVKEIEKFNYKLVTGFIGTPRLLIALNKIGRDDLAYKLLFQKECPSWLYPVTVGATTIWERWDGWTNENGFQDKSMNSFNHFAFGAVGEYFFSCIGGIQPIGNLYSEINIIPSITKELTWAKASYYSMQGAISTHWQVDHLRYRLNVKIPVNVKAHIYVPFNESDNIFESETIAKEALGVTFEGKFDDCCVFSCGSGEYSFNWEIK